jgi:cytoskeletal protein RodZ
LVEFEKKKIQIETLSEYLSAVRRQLGLTLSEVSAKTEVSAKFLQDLEAGNYDKLPADVYVAGFLRKLGVLYSIDSKVLIEQYKKERQIQTHITKSYSLNLSMWENLFKKVIVTPRLLSLVSAAVFVAISCAYIIWQVILINKAPALEIFEPQDQQVVTETYVKIRGKTDSGALLSVNDQTVFVDSEGDFQTQVGLTPGVKELVFVVSNKFEKTTRRSVKVVGQFSPVAGQELTLVLQFVRPTEIGFSLDDKARQEERVVAGNTRTLEAKSRILLSVSDAGAVTATLNGKNLGFLGRNGESLSDIPFSTENAKME